MIQLFAYRPGSTERYRQMKAVWDSCAAASLEPPPEVTQYLNTRGRGPRPDGVEVPVDSAITRVADGSVEVDVSRLAARDIRLLVIIDDGT